MKCNFCRNLLLKLRITHPHSCRCHGHQNRCIRCCHSRVQCYSRCWWCRCQNPSSCYLFEWKKIIASLVKCTWITLKLSKIEILLHNNWQPNEYLICRSIKALRVVLAISQQDNQDNNTNKRLNENTIKIFYLPAPPKYPAWVRPTSAINIKREQIIIACEKRTNRVLFEFIDSKCGKVNFSMNSCKYRFYFHIVVRAAGIMVQAHLKHRFGMPSHKWMSCHRYECRSFIST